MIIVYSEIVASFSSAINFHKFKAKLDGRLNSVGLYKNIIRNLIITVYVSILQARELKSLLP